jgi:hypothetical protein
MAQATVKITALTEMPAQSVRNTTPVLAGLRRIFRNARRIVWTSMRVPNGKPAATAAPGATC